ncbi:hypothetical protein C4J81_18760 (plasmid) [Deltaproteobacteria bacterium Smac51]|nr:hypothetical protein C4J81_18760 [Deltaproteobacteria bacterium Smac51]
MYKFVMIPEVYPRSFQLEPTDPFLETLQALPPKATAFCCGGAFAKANGRLLDTLRKQKRTVEVDSLESLGPECLVVSSFFNKFSPTEKFEQVRASGAKILYYLDYTEENGYVPDKNEYFIYSSEAQLFSCMANGQFSLDSSGRAEAGRMEEGGEGVAVGLLRPHDITKGRDEPREILRRKLAEAMGLEFNPDRLLAVHFTNHNLDSAAVERGLMRLAEHCDILIKHHETREEAIVKLEGPGIFNYYSHYGSVNHHLSYLARYAADVALIGCFSGAAPTTLMMGTKMIPVFTQKVFATGKAREAGAYSSFSTEMRNPFRVVTLKISDCLPPVSLEATEMLWERINDAAYWERYKAELSSIQKAALGSFLLGPAALKRAQAFIVRLMQNGSFFAPGTNKLVMIRPLLSVNVGNPL